MGEALISRAGGGSSGDDIIIPVTPGYHTILATVRTDKGTPMVEYPVSCLDGSSQYNYSTNDKGQVMFTCNSGSANIFINNRYNGIQYIDFDSKWTNVGAPIGQTQRVNIAVSKNNSLIEFTSSKVFSVIEDRAISNLIIIGAGGGGGQGFTDAWDGDSYGGGGGAGYMNQYNNLTFQKNNTYNFICGTGGAGGNDNSSSGGTGGTSYIVNSSYSAVGGGGGQRGQTWISPGTTNGGKGGLGNGGGLNTRIDYNDYEECYIVATNSPINFAGGGGGFGCISPHNAGGFPYGGNGGFRNKGYNGTRAGGGGGGGSRGSMHYNGGKGGNGLCRINIRFD